MGLPIISRKRRWVTLVFHRLKRFLFDRRGSSTIEYVMILAVGAILAMILTVTMGSEEIQSDRKE